MAVRTVAIIVWPVLSYAASRSDPTTLSWFTWSAVIGMALIAYLASSAEILFGWLDTRGWTALGKVVQRFFASLGAGVLSFLVGLYMELPLLACLIPVMPAAYMGEHYLRKFGARWAERDAMAMKE